MQQNPLLYPLLTMILLVFMVWLWLYITRILSVTMGSLNIESYAEAQQTEKPRMVALAGDNFSNQFELPVLFYVLIALLVYLEPQPQDYLFWAWVFVISRYLHALIHLSYNRVMHRLLAYWLGAISLWVMWAKFFVAVV